MIEIDSDNLEEEEFLFYALELPDLPPVEAQQPNQVEQPNQAPVEEQQPNQVPNQPLDVPTEDPIQPLNTPQKTLISLISLTNQTNLIIFYQTQWLTYSN